MSTVAGGGAPGTDGHGDLAGTECSLSGQVSPRSVALSAFVTAAPPNALGPAASRATSPGGSSGGTLRSPSAACLPNLPSLGLPGEEAAATYEPLTIEPYEPYGVPYSPPGAPPTPDGPQAAHEADCPPASPFSPPGASSPSAARLLALAPRPPSSPAMNHRAASCRRSFAKYVSSSQPSGQSLGLGQGHSGHGGLGSHVSSSLSPPAAAEPGNPHHPDQHRREHQGRQLMELAGGCAGSASTPTSPNGGGLDAGSGKYMTALPATVSAPHAGGGGGDAVGGGDSSDYADSGPGGGGGGASSSALLSPGRPTARRLLPPLWHASQSSRALNEDLVAAAVCAAGGDGGADAGAVTAGSPNGSGAAAADGGPCGGHFPSGTAGAEGVCDPGHQAGPAAQERQQRPQPLQLLQLSIDGAPTLPQPCSPRPLLAPLPLRPDLASPPSASLTPTHLQSGLLAAGVSPSSSCPSSEQTSPSKAPASATQPACLSSWAPSLPQGPLGQSTWGPGGSSPGGAAAADDESDPTESSGDGHGGDMAAADGVRAPRVSRGGGGGGFERLLLRAGPLGAAAVCGSAAVRQEMEDAVRLRGRSFVLAGSRSMPAATAAVAATSPLAAFSPAAVTSVSVPGQSSQRSAAAGAAVLADGAPESPGLMRTASSLSRGATHGSAACPIAAAQLPPISGRTSTRPGQVLS